jgi:PAS domain S-box-containing protein
MGLSYGQDTFDLLVNSIEDYAIFMVDVHGCVTTWNPGAERIKGYTAPEILGQSIELFYSGEERSSKPKMLLQKAAHFGSAEDEGWRLRKDGSRFWAHVSITALHDDGKLVGFAKITADQTHRRAVQEQLRLSEERFSSAFEYAAIGMALVALDGHFLRVNRSYCEMLGYSEAELLNLDFQSITHPEDLQADVTQAGQLLRGEIKSYQMEKRYLRKSGEVLWVLLSGSIVREASGAPKHFIAQVEDITHKREAVEALRAQTALLETVIDSMGNGLVVADHEKYLIVNRIAQEITGNALKDKGVEGWRATRDLFMADKKTKFDPANLPLQRALRGEATEETELWLRNKSSKSGKWVRAAGRPLFDGQGAVSGAVVVFRDVTAEKEMEAEIEQNREQSVSNARLAALGVMAGGIAHEINNPLGIIHGAASNLLDVLEQPDPAKDLLRKNSERILRTAERIAKIVSSMRQIARDGSSDPFRQRPLHLIIEETLALCRENFRQHDVELKVSQPDASLLIRCREPQIEQMLLDLLQNALDAVSEIDGERWVHLEVELRQNTVAVSIVDNGPGIPPDARPHVFEPFFTTKPVGKGTGLGLSISKSIAEEHGGKLEICQKEGNTCVTFILPVAEENGK